MVTTGAQLTPTVAPVVRLPVTDVRLSSTRSAVVMKLFDPDPSLPSADWTILLLTLTLLLCLRWLLLDRLKRLLRGRRPLLRFDTEHPVRRPRRLSCRRRRRRRRQRNASERPPPTLSAERERARFTLSVSSHSPACSSAKRSSVSSSLSLSEDASPKLVLGAHACHPQL